MVKEVVVSKHLSEEMIDAGRKLIASLDSSGLSVGGALWLYDPETETWKLVVALPEVNSKGSRRPYQQIQSVISELPEGEPAIRITDITVKDTEDPLIKPLISGVKKMPNLTEHRVSRSTVNGVFLEDAYIFGLN